MFAKVLIFYLIFFMIINNKCLNGLKQLLEKKNMKYNTTIKDNFNLKNENIELLGNNTLTFWLKVYNDILKVNSFILFSFYDSIDEYNLEFDLFDKNFHLFFNKNPLNLIHTNNTWRYYIFNLETKNKELIIASTSFESKTNYTMGNIWTFETKLSLENLNLSLGNKKNNFLDYFTGEIDYLNFYKGNLNWIDEQFNTSFQEPTILYFIEFLKHPSNSQILTNSSNLNFPFSINGSLDYSIDLHDFNNWSSSNNKIYYYSNNFIMNQPYQFIKLTNELLKNTNKNFNQKSIYLKFKILPFNQYAKTNTLPIELFLYKRINTNNNNIISLSFKVNSFTLDNSNLKKQINYNFLLKDNLILCNLEKKFLFNGNDYIDISYLILTINKNPFNDSNLFIKLFYENNNHCLSNSINKLSFSDNHYIGNPNVDISTNDFNKPTIISIIFFEFAFLDGSDIIENNSCNENIKVSGRVKDSFVFICKNSFLIDRKYSFNKCESFLKCESFIQNCEVCENSMICLYCKNNYILTNNTCIQSNSNMVFDIITKNSYVGDNTDLTKENSTNLETINMVNFIKNKIKILKIKFPNTLQWLSLINKNFYFKNEYNYFSESDNFTLYLSIIKIQNESKKLEFEVIHNNTTPPSINYIFDFGNPINGNLLTKDIDINCDLNKKTINFPCRFCQNNFKLLNKNLYSNCLWECPKNYYNNNFICYPCQINTLKCNSFYLDNLSICWKGYFLINNKCIKCDNSCNSCKFNYNFCTSCKNGYFLSKNIYGFGLCKKCDNSCFTCNGIFKNNCLSCKGNQLLFERECMNVCPIHYFKNKYNVCQRCKKNCYICKENINCIKCLDGFFLITVNRNKWCKKCSNVCRTCEINSNNCKLCKNDYLLKNNRCLPICKFNFYLNLWNWNECLICDKCKTCFSNNTENCKNCSKCKKECNLKIDIINENTFVFNAINFKIQKFNISNNIKLYNITNNNLINYNVFPAYDLKKFTLKLKNTNFNILNITITKYLSSFSKNCTLFDKNVIVNLNKYNFYGIHELSIFLKFLNIFLYLLAIIFSFFWEKLSSKIFIQYRLIQFFKYYMLLNLNFSFTFKDFLIKINSNNLVNLNIINFDLMKKFKIYSKYYFDYKPLLIINLDSMIIKNYFILVLIIIFFILKVFLYVWNLSVDNKIYIKENNKKYVKTNKNFKKDLYKTIIFLKFQCLKLILIMIRLDSINYFFLGIILFKYNLYFEGDYFFFVNSLLFLISYTFLFIYFFKCVTWIKNNVLVLKIKKNKIKIIKLIFFISNNPKMDIYLTGIDEVKYLILILNLLIFKRFYYVQIISCLFYDLIFYLFLINYLSKNSIKFILYFLSETLILLLFFPLIIFNFYEYNKFFDYLLIIMILLIYFIKFWNIITYLWNKLLFYRKRFKKFKKKNKTQQLKMNIKNIREIKKIQSLMNKNTIKD